MTSKATRLVLFYLFLGFSSIISQTIMVRELLTIFYGNEMSLGIIFAAWFLWITMGAYTGARIASRVSNPLRVFNNCLLAVCLVSVMQLLAVRVSRAFLSLPGGQYPSMDHLVIVVILVMIPFSFLYGFTFPLGIRALGSSDPRGVQVVGKVYMWEALGSLMGGMIFTYLLAGRIASLLVLWIVLVSLLLLLLWLYQLRHLWVYALLFIIAAFTAFAGLEDWSIKMRWRLLEQGGELLESADSRYQNLVLARHEEQYTLYTNGTVRSSFPDPYANIMLANSILIQHPKPKDVLIIGAGIEGLIAEMLKFPFIETIVYVEQDPRLMELLIDYLAGEVKEALNSERLVIKPGDGRFYLRSTPSNFDLIYINLPDPSTAMLNRYYTREFFREVERKLKPGGTIGLSISTATNYYGELVGRYAASVYRTLKEVFDYIAVSANSESLFFASDAPSSVSDDVKTLVDRYERRKLKSDRFNPYAFMIDYQPDRVEKLKETLQDERLPARINTDLSPITYSYNFLLWDVFSSSSKKGNFSIAAKVFAFIQSIDFVVFLAFILAIFLIRLLYQWLRKPRVGSVNAFNALGAVFIGGFSAMSLNLLLLIAFQNIFGALYLMVGALGASFMFGLAVGSFIANRLATSIAGPRHIFIALEALIAIFALSITRLLVSMSQGYLSDLPAWFLVLSYLLMVSIAGCLTGAAFPLAAVIHVSGSEDTVVSAGMIDGFDHLGAFMGALITGSFFVPIYGIPRTCMLVATLNIAMLLLWIVSANKRRRADSNR